MIALSWLACTPEVPEAVVGLRVTEARIERVGGGGLHVIGGGWAGSGDLVATTVGGEELRVPVDLGAGSLGLMFEFAATPGGTWELDLPVRDVAATDLFGTYVGTRESLVILVGAVGLHLENDAGVRIDDTSLGLGIGLAVSRAWLSVTEHVEETTAATGDSGAEHTGGETGPPPSPTGATGGTADTGDTAAR